jgi:hypothetical protein
MPRNPTWSTFLGISDNVQTKFNFEDVTDYNEAEDSPGFAHCVLTTQKLLCIPNWQNRGFEYACSGVGLTVGKLGTVNSLII